MPLRAATTALALVLFDPSNPDDPFKGVGHWEKALRTALGREPAKLLVASKTDRGAAMVTPKKLNQFCAERGYFGYIPTSARTGEGRREEIARMLSGAEVTSEARAQADRLLSATG